MSAKLQKLIANWKPRIEANQNAQYEAAKKYDKYHYAIGLPTTILTAIAGATLLTETTDPTIKTIVGVVGLVAAALSAVQTFYSYARRSESHRSTSVRLGDIRREIEILEQYPPDDEMAEKEHVLKINDFLSKIGETAPIIYDDVPAR